MRSKLWQPHTCSIGTSPIGNFRYLAGQLDRENPAARNANLRSASRFDPLVGGLRLPDSNFKVVEQFQDRIHRHRHLQWIVLKAGIIDVAQEITHFAELTS